MSLEGRREANGRFRIQPMTGFVTVQDQCSLRALERINVLKKVTRKRFIFRPSSINNFPYQIYVSLDLSLKNCAHWGTLGGGLFPPRVYGNLAEFLPNFYRSEKPID